MCGFTGFFLCKDSSDFDRNTILRAMGDQIAHRGPDDEQVYSEGNLCVLFRRLSIVDIEGGQQPLMNSDQSIVLWVNGEIYNYKELIQGLKKKPLLTTKSDCEVLIHLYQEMGVDFLKKINGMFGLALWDSNKKIFLLARDRLGIKPLYYSKSDKRLLFGSEIKSLLPFPDCPREFNWQEALDTHKKLYAHDHYQVETYFKGINQLKGGQYLLINEDNNEISIDEYWSIFDAIDHKPSIDNRDESEFISGYYALLKDSVNLMLLGDVDIGLFLSGGIDSSAIAALASKRMKIETFSVLNDDTIESGDSLFANELANSLGISNHQVNITYDPKVHTADFWKRLVWQCETYECGTEQLFKYELHRHIKKKFPHLKIILLGQGSDEFNGGYAHKYVNEPAPEKVNRWPEFERIISDVEKDGLFLGENQGLTSFHNFINRDYLAKSKKSKIRASSWFTFINAHSKNLQLYQLLHEDRTAMANSIENRVPFLDHRIIEFIVQIPEQHFSKLFWNKNILRKGMEGDLEEVFCVRPKVPFIFDNKNVYSRKIVFDIFTNNDDELIRYALGESGLAHEVLDRNSIEELIAEIRSDPALKRIDELKFLVNMGILSKILDDNEGGEMSLAEADPDYKTYCNKNSKEQGEYEKFVKRSKARMSKGAVTDKLMLHKEVEFLTDLNGIWYVFLEGDLVEFVYESEKNGKIWIDVLRYALGNKCSVSRAVKDLCHIEKDLSTMISKSLKSKIIYKKRNNMKSQS